MTFLIVPANSNAPSYTEKVALDAVVYQLAIYFNDRLGCWMMDVQDQNGNELLASIPLLPGYPLNWRYAQRIPNTPPGILYLIDESGALRVPGRQDLGNGENLYYLQAGA